jgi:hypothetical protein
MREGHARVSIISVATAVQEEWKEYCNSTEYCTFFHTPRWFHIFERYFAGSFRAAPLKVTFDDRTAVILPVGTFKKAGGLFRIHVSSVAGTYGGWLGREEITAEHQAQLLDFCKRQYNNFHWRENPLDTSLASLPIQGSQEDFTQLIDFESCGSDYLAHASRAHRKALKKASRNGITVETAGRITEWRVHYDLYCDSWQRWKNQGEIGSDGIFYRWELFKLLHALPSDFRTLWVAKHKGEIVAGVVCLYHNRHAVAWHGAASADHFNIRPNNLLYDAMIHDAAERGFRWFDCNPSGGQEGVQRFKQHLGTQKVRSRIILWQTPLTGLARRLRRVAGRVCSS